MAERNFTDLQLERHLAGELEIPNATDADRARLGELRAEHEAFLRGIDVDNEVRRIQQRAARAVPEKRLWWRWLVPAGALAAAAAVVLVFVRRGSEPSPDDDMQVKGEDITLLVHVATTDGSRRVATGDTVQSGDRIRFEINAQKPGFVAVIGVDGAGVASVYYPEGGAEPATFDPKTRVLPGAIELDATPGDEKFYAIYGRSPFDVYQVMNALTGGAAIPPGLTKAEVVLHKKLPP